MLSERNCLPFRTSDHQEVRSPMLSKRVQIMFMFIIYLFSFCNVENRVACMSNVEINLVRVKSFSYVY